MNREFSHRTDHAMSVKGSRPIHAFCLFQPTVRLGRSVGILLAMFVVGFPLRAWSQEGDAASPPKDAAAAENRSAEEKPSPESQTASQKQKKAPALSIDLQPYQVLVGLGFQSHSQFDKRFREALLQGIRDRIQSRLGEFWQAEVKELAWLNPSRKAVLDQMGPQDLSERFLSEKYDKVFLSTMDWDGTKIRISLLEWDRNSQTLSPVTGRSLSDSRSVADTFFAEMLLQFRPLAEVEQVFEDGVTVEFLIRAGELMPPDAAALPFAVGSYIRPYYRYFNRKKELRKLQDVPWTFVRITEIKRGRMTGTVISAFRQVLAGSRRRVELMAIAVKPKFPETELTIFPRGQRDNPMAGTRIDVMNRRPTDEDAVEDRLTFLTNRMGSVRIPYDPTHPLQYVYVMSGRSVLARVPFIPGDVPMAELEVPDDTARLGVEGEIALMEAELIEIVARREVLMARALDRAKKKLWSEVDAIHQELKALPTRQDLEKRVERIELSALRIAQLNNDRVAGKRIQSLCRKYRNLVEKHLKAERIREHLQEVQEIRNLK